MRRKSVDKRQSEFPIIFVTARDLVTNFRVIFISGCHKAELISKGSVSCQCIIILSFSPLLFFCPFVSPGRSRLFTSHLFYHSPPFFTPQVAHSLPIPFSSSMFFNSQWSRHTLSTRLKFMLITPHFLALLVIAFVQLLPSAAAQFPDEHESKRF